MTMQNSKYPLLPIEPLIGGLRQATHFGIASIPPIEPLIGGLRRIALITAQSRSAIEPLIGGLIHTSVASIVIG